MIEVLLDSLYVHSPFCVSKCAYCDFNSYAGIDWLVPRYASALQTELKRWAAARDISFRDGFVSTIYFGGGTPLLLGAERIVRVLDTCRGIFNIKAGSEVSVEGNPGAVEEAEMNRLLRAGVNRISLGVQSFDDDELRMLGRGHRAEEAVQALNIARSAGFTNVSLDLIYGLPGQNLESWRHTLEHAVSLAPEHLSAYALTLEEGTPMARDVSSGLMPEPDPDAAADMYVLAESMLESAGYEHYEISNWARPGRECRHNVLCWRNGSYLGFGAGAHSHIGPYRFANVRSPLEYVERSESGAIQPSCGPSSSRRDSAWKSIVPEGVPVELVECIDEKTAMAETMMLGLRLSEGIEVREFRRRFGKKPFDIYGEQLKELSGLGLVSADDRRIRLTPRGRLLGNQVFCRFFL